MFLVEIKTLNSNLFIKKAQKKSKFGLIPALLKPNAK